MIISKLEKYCDDDDDEKRKNNIINNNYYEKMMNIIRTIHHIHSSI